MLDASASILIVEQEAFYGHTLCFITPCFITPGLPAGPGNHARLARIPAGRAPSHATAGQALAWAARLAVLCVLLYTAFWVAVVLFVAVAVLWMADHADPRDWEPVEVEWRDGHSGWGLYDKTEWRHDPGSPDDLV